VSSRLFELASFLSLEASAKDRNELCKVARATEVATSLALKPVAANGLNYIHVEVARTPNHQSPDHEVNCQRREDFPSHCLPIVVQPPRRNTLTATHRITIVSPPIEM
jgi:hypothetical protein